MVCNLICRILWIYTGVALHFLIEYVFVFKRTIVHLWLNRKLEMTPGSTCNVKLRENMPYMNCVKYLWLL